jgi:cyclic pyranopterin phosphate synthase
MYCLPETEAAQNFYRGRWATLPQAAPITHHWQSRSNILTFEEIERIVRIAVELGIQKVRLTGGEPLLRQELEKLVERLAAITALQDLALTTNGFLFPKKGKALRDSGLRRVSFSLDSLDADNFKRITGRDGLAEVLASIDLAQELGLAPVKVNSVVIRGINDHEVEALAEFARSRAVSMRFIEFMPLDSGRVWLKELVVPGKEILERLQQHFSLIPVRAENKSETAKRWTIGQSKGEIGIIAPVSEPFCGHCNRLRLTADGKIRTCLFSAVEHDLRSRLRSGTEDSALREYLCEVVLQKEDRHHIGEETFVPASRSMSCIGG